MRTILRLKSLGIRDIGFAMTISGDNCRDLVDVYTLAASMDLEFANAVVHNSFYFHKYDNEIENKEEVQAVLTDFVKQLLSSPRKNLKKRMKDWFRAYLTLGLLRHVQGKDRLIPCGSGTDTFFLDPWGHVLSCNGSVDPMIMGDLRTQSFENIWRSEQANVIREQVRNCRQFCWMTGTAVPAMRGNPWVPLRWVLRNKFRVAQGKPPLL
jgi:MoaA/NifB/PqqE/SkfB family radical SAM enzyme